MGRAKSLENTMMLGKNAGKRRMGQQRMACLDGITDSMDMSLSKLQEITGGQRSLACYSPRGHKESDIPERLNCTELCLECFLYEKEKELKPTDSETSHLVGLRRMNGVHGDSRNRDLDPWGGREESQMQTAQ